MNDSRLENALIEIFGEDNFSKQSEILEDYSSDLSFTSKQSPLCVCWATKRDQVEKIVKLANKLGFPIVPVSSPSQHRFNGDTIPKKEGSVILDLSKLNNILEIDKKNRVIMVEPGVTFGTLITLLKKKGLRLLLPLLPRSDKSVLTTALERVPITLPRHHWDSSDPLLCTEVVFGSGDLFRTGTAAGPGSLKEQKKTGQAQKNPMGPTQFSPYRVIQGSQGSIGVVTWATLKLEFLPTLQKLYHVQSSNLQDLLELQHELIKYRLCEEVFIVNNLNLACLLERKPEKIKELASIHADWNLIFILAGRGKLARDKLEYLDGDLNDILIRLKLNKLDKITAINNHEIINVLNTSTSNPWRLRLKGGSQDIFFLTSMEKIQGFIDIANKKIQDDLGIYIQAINQGTACHVEFNCYHDPLEKENIKDQFIELSITLMDNGAFFNRPYGPLAKDVYARHDENTTIALKKVKGIFDPNNVLNPGVLCFDD